MKSQTLPTKRTPVSKGVFRKLSAVTQGRRRKQRASTAASARGYEDGQGETRIGRALFVILLIHLLVVAMILVHHHFLSDRPVDEVSAPIENVKVAESPAVVIDDNRVVRAEMSFEQAPHVVKRGETYSSIAAIHQVSETDLRGLNGNPGLRSGLLLKIPVKRVMINTTREQTVDQGESTPVRNPQTAPAAPARDQGLVEAVDTRNAPRATAIHVAGNKSYVVQKGDTVWGIANRHGVDQQALKEANGITDPRKLQAGMTLRIP